MTASAERDERVLALSPGLRRVLADNPSAMTLEGTNTWIVGDPAESAPLVVDPGPDDGAHLDRVLRAAGGRVAGIVLTHRHLDHSEGAAALAATAGCVVHAVDPALRLGTETFGSGVRLSTGGSELTVEATPGHTGDSVCLLLSAPGEGVRLLTGDTVLGRGTTVITHPDGDLGAYLASLDLLERLVAEHGVRQLLPGHGPVRDDPAAVIAGYRQHRLDRLEQVRAAVAAGARTPSEIVDRVYAEVDPAVRYAAEQSVRAQLDHLRRS